MLVKVKHFTKVLLNIDKLRAHMEAAMGHHIHVDNKVSGSRKENLDCIRTYILKEEQV